MSSNAVLLGIKDDIITPEDATSWKTNKIGGSPDWMPSNTPVTNIPQCQLCDKKMALVVQVYCPLGTSPYDRTLYIFCCINQICWNKQGSWQVYRIQHLTHNKQNVKEETSCAKEETWLSEELDWDDEDEDNNNSADIIMNSNIPECNTVAGQNLPTDETETSYFSGDCNPLTITLLEANRASTQNLPWQPPDTLIVPPDYSPVFKPLFISVIEEPPMENDSDGHIQKLLNSYQGKEFQIDPHMKTASGVELYEKNCANHGDRIFQKFANRVARCQEQVIRYCWKGEPLLMREETLPLLACQYCHGPVVYELQLMPALVTYLRLQNVENEDVAVEFGTVMIFTCQNSCWEENAEYRIENICIQSDPDEDLFQQRL